jgi:hypothetical protein
MNIIANGKPRDVSPYKKLSYDEIVVLIYGPQISEEPVFTVTYYHSPTKKSGSLNKGESVVLKNRMVFNVYKTNKA